MKIFNPLQTATSFNPTPDYDWLKLRAVGIGLYIWTAGLYTSKYTGHKWETAICIYEI